MEYTTVLLLIAVLATLLWVGGVLYGVVDTWRRRQRWVAVFEGEYRAAKKLQALLDSSGIQSEISPLSTGGSALAGVTLRVLSQDERGARKLIGDMER
jgi:hypothetical protein